MKVGLAFRELIPQPVVDALDHMWATIAAGYHTEHHADDTHGDVHADTLTVTGDIVNGTIYGPAGQNAPSGGPKAPATRDPILHANRITLTGGVRTEAAEPIGGRKVIDVVDDDVDGTAADKQTVKLTEHGLFTTTGAVIISQNREIGTAALHVSNDRTISNTVNIRPTWDNAGIAYVGLSLQITDTGSSASSLPVSMWIGSSLLFEVDPNGDLRFGDGTIRRPDDTGDAAVFGNGTTTFTADQHDFVDTDGTLRLRITDTLTLLNRTPLILGSAGGPRIAVGTGSPEGVVSALVGSLFLRQDGGTSTTLYVKESGIGVNGWVAK